MSEKPAAAAPVTEIGSAPPGSAPPPERSPGEGQKGNRRVLKAIVVGPRMKEELTTGKSKEIPTDDLLENLAADGRMIEPPFDKLVLAMLPENSTALYQCIEAMEVNIEGFGHRLDCLVKVESPECSDEMRDEVRAEKIRLTNFFNTCCVDDSFIGLRRKTRRDIESTGEGYWEVIRVPSTGEIAQLNHIASYQVRLGVLDKEFTLFERNVPVIQPDGSVVLEKRKYQKRFRRFIQARIAIFSRAFAQGQGYAVRWFKEFGDPRVIDNETGEVVPPEKQADFPEERRAGELIHWRLYSARTPYGLPRYIGNLITIFGDRAADEINYLTLKNNNVPSMIVTVSNGQLTDGTIKRIEEFVETQIAESPNYSRFLIMEGEGAIEGQDAGHVKIEVRPLTSEQMRDQLFQEYSKNNRAKLRENWRLPPIFVGLAEDYTRATAESSRRLADEQVFRPERDEFDNTMNRGLMPELGSRFHRFVSNGPNVTDDEDLIKVLEAAEKTGGMTPRVARQIIGDILGRDLAAPDPSVKLDVPFSLQMAEAVKNEAEMRVGTQVTALKAVSDIVLKKLAEKRGDGAVADILEIRDQLEEELGRRLG